MLNMLILEEKVVPIQEKIAEKRFTEKDAQTKAEDWYQKQKRHSLSFFIYI